MSYGNEINQNTIPSHAMAASFVFPSQLSPATITTLPFSVHEFAWQSRKQSGDPEKHDSPMVPPSMRYLRCPRTTILTLLPSSTRQLKSKEKNYKSQSVIYRDVDLLVLVWFFRLFHFDTSEHYFQNASLEHVSCDFIRIFRF